MNLALPLKRTIADQVAEILRDRILAGQLKSGQPIRQEHLAAELGVSRIPLREALKQLAAEGFVSLLSHRGAIVAELSVEEVTELFDLRAKLEIWLLEEALPNMGPSEIARLEEVLTMQRRDDSVMRWGELNWDLHEAMYAPAGRPATLKILKNIHDKLDRYLRVEVTMRSGRDRGLREHEELVEKCRKRDIKGATALLDRHIAETARGLIAALRARQV